MKSKFKPLSVAENDYKSDRIAAECIFNYAKDRLRIEFTEIGELNIYVLRTHGMPITLLHVGKVDIDSMQEFLKDSKQFISESEIIRKLQNK